MTRAKSGGGLVAMGNVNILKKDDEDIEEPDSRENTFVISRCGLGLERAALFLSGRLVEGECFT